MERNHTNVGTVESASGAQVHMADFILKRNHRNVKNVTSLLSVGHTLKSLTGSIQERNLTNVRNVTNHLLDTQVLGQVR